MVNKKKTNKAKNLASVRINETPISAQDLRVVCDDMLMGLGKELRRCGIDTVILENGRDHTDVARVCYIPAPIIQSYSQS